MRLDRRLEEYRVPFIGLKEGNHEFTFFIGKEFFAAFEYSEIADASIDVKVQLEKTATMLIFHSELNGKVRVDCDRCGEPIDQPVKADYQLIVKFGVQTGSSEDDVLILGPSEHEVDLSQFLYEYAHLSLPARRVHGKVEQCNQDILAKLDSLRVETDSESQWIALKDMKLDDSSPGDEEE